MSHRGRVVLAVALQLVILVAIAAARQWTLSTGAVVLLETAPVDPRDLFRGDYVVLNYRISSLQPYSLGSTATFSPGQRVYVGLRQQGEVWVANSIATSPPDGMFIRGTVRWHFSTGVQIDYGIGSYFVPEGTGRRIETARRQQLAVEVALGRDGTAQIRRLLLDGQPYP